MMNSSSAFDYKKTEQWLLDLKWTPALAAQWQKLFNDAPHLSLFARNGQYEDELVDHSTKYEDLKPTKCTK
ncbi:unnamed protein product [Rotaria sp. Silwood2]|nr:unnamed protein product [Rotaria sp. Silwood2]